MKKLFRKILFTALLTFCLSVVNATPQTVPSSKSIVVDVKSGNLTLKELLVACPNIAKSVSSKWANKALTNEIITIQGQKYQIRFFSFEDTSGKLPKNTTFHQYAIDRSLLEMKSIAMDPLPGIHFESFDYRRADLKDGVYFSMAVRPLDDEDISN